MKQHIKEKLRKQLGEFVEFRWHLSIDLLAVLLSYFAIVFTVYLAFQVVTTSSPYLNFIIFGPISILLLGVFVPLSYHAILKKRPLSAMGIKKDFWLISLFLSITFGLISYAFTISPINLPPLNMLLPLIVMSLAIGLFETLFFRGWLQLRLEDAFGSIPAIIVGAIFYSFYHLSYGVQLYDLWYLFLLGVLFALIFRITRNILILWPFYTTIYSFYLVVNQEYSIPFNSAYGFLIIIILILSYIIVVYKKVHKYPMTNQ